jgi:hypothetical protein
LIKAHDLVANTSLFPSPCGVNIVAKVTEDFVKQISFWVSVPLRGKYRGEEDFGTWFVYYRDGVSVPLRGKYRGEA